MSKILVTGGTGFVGSNLVLALVNQGNEVLTFDNGFRNNFSQQLLLDNNVSIINGDITNKDDWNKIPKDIDIAFHLAAINGTKFFYEIPDQVLNVNINGIFNFIDWLSKTSVKRVFFASSSEVYGLPKIFPTPETEPLTLPDPTNPRYSYCSSKIVGETIIINFSKSLGFVYSIGRIHNAYGPKMGFEHVIPEFLRKCLKNETFTVQGDGTESRSFCYVTDVVEGIMLITSHNQGENQIFNVGNSSEITINELIKLIEKIHGKKIDPVYSSFKNSGTKRRVPDISKIKKLGYEPKISLEYGIKKMHDWYADYYKNTN